MTHPDNHKSAQKQEKLVSCESLPADLVDMIEKARVSPTVKRNRTRTSHDHDSSRLPGELSEKADNLAVWADNVSPDDLVEVPALRAIREASNKNENRFPPP